MPHAEHWRGLLWVSVRRWHQRLVVAAGLVPARDGLCSRSVLLLPYMPGLLAAGVMRGLGCWRGMSRGGERAARRMCHEADGSRNCRWQLRCLAGSVLPALAAARGVRGCVLEWRTKRYLACSILLQRWPQAAAAGCFCHRAHHPCNGGLSTEESGITRREE